MEVTDQEIKSIPSLFTEVCRERGDRIAMRFKDLGLWQEYSWNDYYAESVKVANSLISLGINAGDFVGIIGENCPEWLFMDMGIQLAGARTVGIYTTNSWQQVQYIINHSECRVLFAENEEQVDKWLAMKAEVPSLEYIVYWDKKGLERMDDPGVMYYPDFLKKGESLSEIQSEEYQERAEKVDPEDISLLVYTSGTTGPPKGVMLSGRNIIWTARTLYEMGLVSEKDQTMSFLPLCHIFERMFSAYFHICAGYTINFAESTETIAKNLTEIRPTIGYAVPRVWEKFQSRILLRIEDAPWLNRWLFRLATRVGMEYANRKLDNRPVGITLRIKRFLAYWGVLYPLKYMMGINRMRYAISGAAPISPKVLRFYHMLELPIIEGYGMTETSALITFSTPTDFKLGTVGRPILENAVKISEEGEILARHPGVTSGYYKDEVSTSNTIMDGWLHTGDIGKFDEEGYLTILDRKKDIIITAGGKNIAPQKIENKLKFSIYINDAIVIGDKRKFISAIIILDEENINKYARDHKISYSSYSELADHPEIRKLIAGEVRQVNKELARVETIRNFTILDKRLYVEDGEVTPTMKVKRKFINEEYQELIEKMYQ